jgi:hypothetical protein
MKTIKIFGFAGSFAENKDAARDVRVKLLVPLLEKGEEVVLDFEKVESVTQSFIHALFSELMRKFGVEVLDKVAFKNCNSTVKGIINIVVDYMQI